jgi:hypothetical protein
MNLLTILADLDAEWAAREAAAHDFATRLAVARARESGVRHLRAIGGREHDGHGVAQAGARENPEPIQG